MESCHWLTSNNLSTEICLGQWDFSLVFGVNDLDVSKNHPEMLHFLNCSPLPTKKAKMKAEIFNIQREYEKTKCRLGFLAT